MTATVAPVLLALTGQLPLVVITAAVAALPISLLILRRYRSAVLKSMARRVEVAGSPESEIPAVVANRRWSSDDMWVDHPVVFVIMPFSEPWSDTAALCRWAEDSHRHAVRSLRGG